MAVHQFCSSKNYIKNNICNTIDLDHNGKYKIIGLKDYIDLYISTEEIIKDETIKEGLPYHGDSKKFVKEDINGIEHVVFFRVDKQYFYDNDLFSYYKSYEERMNDYARSDTNIYEDTNFPIISYSLPKSKYKDLSTERWGQQASIGIYVGLNMREASWYISKIRDLQFVLIKFYFPINNDIKILLIPKKCTWTDITCDKIANEKYDLIGHLPNNTYNDNPEQMKEFLERKIYSEYTLKSLFDKTELIYELNILDNGRNKMTKYDIIKMEKENGNSWKKTNDDIKTIIINKSIYESKKDDDKYQHKYIKYKLKYQNIKKNIINKVI
jgi:hypothetical protein